MKERPILFSGPMVRAILDGAKTQTRRLCKVPAGYTMGERDAWLPCPHGAPGDRLWVRETWQTGKGLDEHSPSKITAIAMEAGYATGWGPLHYAADGHSVGTAIFDQGSGNFGGMFGKVRQSIFMPRWASRILLEITEVRVQRLQDITEADARAEGVTPAPFCKSGRPSGMEHVEAFEDLWDEINGDRATWASNPWVWAISFRRVP